MVEDRPIQSRRKCSPKNLVFSDMSLWQYSQRLPRTSALFIGTCMVYIHFSIVTRRLGFMDIGLEGPYDFSVRPDFNVTQQSHGLFAIAKLLSRQEVSHLVIKHFHIKSATSCHELNATRLLLQKLQSLYCTCCENNISKIYTRTLKQTSTWCEMGSVSYTHLTLPTKRIV